MQTRCQAGGTGIQGIVHAPFPGLPPYVPASTCESLEFVQSGGRRWVLMEIDHVAGETRGALDPLRRDAGPTVLRMVVGARLRQLREAHGVSAAEAGEVIRASHSKISRMELGRTGFKRRDLDDLLGLYGLDDQIERERLLDLAQQANAPAWWQEYRDVVPGWFEQYLGLEQGADLIRGYEVQFVPGLLQTADYARAVIRLGHDDAPAEEIDRRVDLRLRRQEIVCRSRSPRLWFIVDEAALRRRVGGRATLHAQLEYLIEVADHPDVTVQVMPFAAGGHAAAGGPITLLRFAETGLPDMVYLEQLASALYPDRVADLRHYSVVMDRLSIEAAPPAATIEIVRRVLEET